ncbi:recombinase A [Actinobacillus equuli]|nr:recombinase A [Actinobacillus equuli]
MRLGDTQALDIEAVSTGSIGLDAALGIGGLPMDVLLRSMARNLQVKQH